MQFLQLPRHKTRTTSCRDTHLYESAMLRPVFYASKLCITHRSDYSPGSLCVVQRSQYHRIMQCNRCTASCVPVFLLNNAVRLLEMPKAEHLRFCCVTARPSLQCRCGNNKANGRLKARQNQHLQRRRIVPACLKDKMWSPWQQFLHSI